MPTDETEPSFTSPIRESRPGSAGRQLLLFDDRKMLSSSARGSKLDRNADLSSHTKTYLRKNRGNFVNFDQFRSSDTGAPPVNSSAAGSSRIRPSTPNSIYSKSSKTIRGVPVSSSMFDYYGDEVRDQASRGQLKKKETECEAMFAYLGATFQKQERDRANKTRKSAADKARADAGGQRGDIAALVRAGPCYWVPFLSSLSVNPSLSLVQLSHRTHHASTCMRVRSPTTRLRSASPCELSPSRRP